MEIKQNFVHLHVHTNISVQDALPSPKELVMYARSAGFPAIAITDHGRMGGVVDFVSACRQPADGLPMIKPIIGYEAYTYADRHHRGNVEREDGTSGKPRYNHITLLAQNDTGYKNLMEMTYIAAKEGFYYKPLIDWEVISSHSEGVIVLSGCMGGEVSQAILRGDMESAERIMKSYKEVFGDRYYAEIQYHGIPEQKTILAPLRDLARKLDIKIVASNDTHYLKKEDYKIHDALLQMMRIKNKDPKATNSQRDAYKTRAFYVKSEAEMAEIFGKFCPESLSNTLEIADRVEDFLKLDVPHLLPKANIPVDETFTSWWKNVLPYNKENEAYLAYLAFKGLKKLGYDKSKIYVDRLKSELTQIWYMGVVDYFLIQNELVEFMQSEHIWYGIRGSGVGSLVNYCIGVCAVDPIRWNLLFPRFLNPGRGTQYSINVSSVPVKEWLAENGKQDQTECVARLQSIIDEKKKEDEFKPVIPEMEKELWILDNQGLAAYLCDIADKQIKTSSNESQLWFAYLLGITDQKPTEGLIVAKVATLPDVDTDIDDSRRSEVIEWVKNRFGHDHVSQIGTRGTYKARMAVTNCLKISEKFNKDWGDGTIKKAQEISKTIPERTVPPMTIAEAKQESSDFATWAKRYPEEITMAEGLIGKIASTGVHAAGVLVSSVPIYQATPIDHAKDDQIASGYDMSSVERVGLVKYDFLGIAAYNMINKALKMIEKRHGKKINIIKLDFNDPSVYELYRLGKTSSLFQVSGAGMKKALRDVNVDCLEDLIAVLALYRPGPLEFIPDYAAGKRNPSSVKYKHPLIEKHLGVTYGIMVYQEQAMFLAREMGGLDWQEVDKLRKAISKKKGDQFTASCNLLKSRAIARGIPEDVVLEVLRLMEKFGGYAFNRSHSCSYAVLSYWTAWLRRYYPAEWLAACIDVDSGGVDAEQKFAAYKKECREDGIKVIPPNVNDSNCETTVTDKGYIAMPLVSIKGVANNAKSVVAHQPFESLEDFVVRARPNRGMVVSLVDANALDCFPDVKNMQDNTEIMDYFDSLVTARNKNEKQAVKEAKMKYKVLTPMAAMKQKMDEIKENKSEKLLNSPFNSGINAAKFK